MTNQELERLLAQKAKAAPRENIAAVLTPDIYRNAARLKKRRQDRIQMALCALAAVVFILLTAGLMILLQGAENPDVIIQRLMYAGLGGMTLTLLLAPVLAWYSEQEAS